MTILRRRPRAFLAASLVSVLVTFLIGCGGDDGDASVDTDTTTTAALEESTTTAGDDGGSTTTEVVPDEGETTTTVAEDEGPGDGGGDATETDEEAQGVNWTLSATQFNGQDGQRVRYDCPPDGEPAVVWGSGTYTDDSSVCTAAVHAGLITFEDGGRVVIEIAPGQEAYNGSEANDVTTSDYGYWDGSFTFPKS